MRGSVPGSENLLVIASNSKSISDNDSIFNKNESSHNENPLDQLGSIEITITKNSDVSDFNKTRLVVQNSSSIVDNKKTLAETATIADIDIEEQLGILMINEEDKLATTLKANLSTQKSEATPAPDIDSATDPDSCRFP